MAKRGFMAIAAISMFILACPTGHAALQVKEGTKACEKAHLKNKQCEPGADKCHYKFTVTDVDGQKLQVTYPPSVWSVSKVKETDPDKEKKHKDEFEKHSPYPIDLKQSSATPKQGLTYIFTRCPDNEFTLVEEVGPNDTHEDRQPKPKP